jgi:hypothetical protein
MNKTSVPLIVVFLVAILLMAYFMTPQQHSMLETIRPGYFHFWNFKGVTQQEYVEGPAYTVDEVNFPVTSNIQKIVDECKYATIAYITKELIDNITAHGYQVTVNKIDPIVHVEQRWETREYRDYTVTTIYSKITIDCNVEFETDKPLVESPIPVWLLVLLLALIDKLPVILIATLVGLGIYVGVTAWMSSFVVSQSTVTTEYYDEQGHLIKKITETIKGTPFWDIGAWLLIALFGVSVLLLIWFVGVPALIGKKGSKR